MQKIIYFHWNGTMEDFFSYAEVDLYAENDWNT
jgi:hypothetical protein